jgi:hypothetical protein
VVFQAARLHPSAGSAYYRGTVDGISGVGSASTLDVASGGTSSIAMSVLASTEKLVAEEAQRLFASLGLGTAISALA